MSAIGTEHGVDWANYDTEHYIPDGHGMYKVVAWDPLSPTSADGRTSFAHQITARQSETPYPADSMITAYLKRRSDSDLVKTALDRMDPESRNRYLRRAAEGTLPTDIEVEWELLRHLQSEQNAQTDVTSVRTDVFNEEVKRLAKAHAIDGEVDRKLRTKKAALEEAATGPKDSCLTAWGAKGAADLGEQRRLLEKAGSAKPDAIICSDMVRTRETCLGAYGEADGFCAPLMITATLRERFYPHHQETHDATLDPEKSTGEGSSSNDTSHFRHRFMDGGWLGHYDRQHELAKSDDGSLHYRDPFAGDEEEGLASVDETQAEFDARTRSLIDMVAKLATVYAGAKASSETSDGPVKVKIATMGHGGTLAKVKELFGTHEITDRRGSRSGNMSNGQQESLILSLGGMDGRPCTDSAFSASLTPRFIGNTRMPRYYEDEYGNERLMPKDWAPYRSLQNRWDTIRMRPSTPRAKGEL